MPGEDAPAADPRKSEYLTFGGLAVVEGVMMRSPNHYSVACRAPNGNIVVKTEPLAKTWIGRQEWLKKPFLRGTLALLDTMILGYKSMNWAAEVQTNPEYQPPSAEPAKPVERRRTLLPPMSPAMVKLLEKVVIVATVVCALVFQVLFFRQLPEHIAEEIVRAATGSSERNVMPFATNYLAEVTKVFLIVGFLALISRMPTMMEVFRYHGAEHKAINTVEAHEDLSIENAARQTRLHPRCGTNFLITVTMLAFILVPAIPRDLIVPLNSPGWMLALSRLPINLVVLPVLAGISYEIIRAAGKAKNQRWVEIILKPGLLTQLITTAEPASKHLEVAIVALNSVVKAEDSGQLTVSDDYREPEPVLA